MQLENTQQQEQTANITIRGIDVLASSRRYKMNGTNNPIVHASRNSSKIIRSVHFNALQSSPNGLLVNSQVLSSSSYSGNSGKHFVIFSN